ncbi:hypothetical protein ACTXT7_008488 [Hymenolepis weldensis]
MNFAGKSTGFFIQPKKTKVPTGDIRNASDDALKLEDEHDCQVYGDQQIAAKCFAKNQHDMDLLRHDRLNKLKLPKQVTQVLAVKTSMTQVTESEKV